VIVLVAIHFGIQTLRKFSKQKSENKTDTGKVNQRPWGTFKHSGVRWRAWKCTKEARGAKQAKEAKEAKEAKAAKASSTQTHWRKLELLALTLGDLRGEVQARWQARPAHPSLRRFCTSGLQRTALIAQS